MFQPNPLMIGQYLFEPQGTDTLLLIIFSAPITQFSVDYAINVELGQIPAQTPKGLDIRGNWVYNGSGVLR